jgi:anhydro-N-acetylmuramic acid kinase
MQTSTTSERFIGIMSGTSLDGLDVVLIRRHGPKLHVERGHTYPYDAALQQRLLALCSPSANEIQTMLAADVELGRFIAASVNRFLDEAGLKAGEIRAIGSHGQTIRHLPDGEHPNTLQIGDPNTIAQLTGITTVADFRRRDMAAGGQGAPLVPAFHQAMFLQTGEDRVVVNIGGIANITVLPGDSAQPVTGFDTGPGNVLMDAWYRQHQQGDCDRSGQWAQSGKVDTDLMEAMASEGFLHKAPPKSTGRELFNAAWLQQQLEGRELRPEDVQASLCQFTADTIMQAIRQHAGQARRILVCGGGVHNDDLMRRLRTQAPEKVAVQSTAEHGIDPDCVEGACFAWMAGQTLDGETSNLPAVTGAQQSVILGGIYQGS